MNNLQNDLHQSNIMIFAQLNRAFLECNDSVQEAILGMLDILTASDSQASEKEMALATVHEALFPSTHNGALGADVAELEESAAEDPNIRSVLEEMDAEEAEFVDRVDAAMKAKGLSQTDLADALGIGQPAVSMMLARKSRPQKRTVKKIAEALGVSSGELWPNFQE